MDENNNYTGSPSKEFTSRELEAFAAESRFDNAPTDRMFDSDWANTELVPLLQHAYGNRSEICGDHDFSTDLDIAELIEPWHMARGPLHSLTGHTSKR